MNTQENRRKWTAALRSGEFEQGTGQLRVRDRFCCLGVACELYRRETGEGEWLESGAFTHNGELRASLPQASVEGWFGICSQGLDELSRLNDNGFSFKMIADYIDVAPEGWFT